MVASVPVGAALENMALPERMNAVCLVTMATAAVTAEEIPQMPSTELLKVMSCSNRYKFQQHICMIQNMDYSNC